MLYSFRIPLLVIFTPILIHCAQVTSQNQTKCFFIERKDNEDFTRLDLECFKSCPLFFRANPNATIAFSNTINCLECSENCLACEKLSVCQLCARPTYYLETEGSVKCVKNCPFRDSYFSQQQTCRKCPVGCSKCTSERWCVRCEKGYNLHSSVIDDLGLTQQLCIPLCPEGYFSQNKVCTPCSDGCLQCDNRDVCKNCASPYYYVDITSVMKSINRKVICVDGCSYSYVVEQLDLYSMDEVVCNQGAENMTCECNRVTVTSQCSDSYTIIVLITLLSTFISGAILSAIAWSCLKIKRKYSRDITEETNKPIVAPRPSFHLPPDMIPRYPFIKESVSDYSFGSVSYVCINFPEPTEINNARRKSSTYIELKVSTRNNSTVPDIIYHEFDDPGDTNQNGPGGRSLRKTSVISDGGLTLHIPRKHILDANKDHTLYDDVLADENYY